MTELAGNGSFVNIFHENETDCPKSKRRRNIEKIRKKRLERKKKKKEEYRKLSKQERRSKMKDKLCRTFQEEIAALTEKLETSQRHYVKERQLSAYCWRKWKKESRFNTMQSHKSNIKIIERENLISEKDGPFVLGKGCFGKCMKMEYRNITVAVKKYESFVTPSLVLWEASIINQLDHQGLPLLLGVNLSENPLLMVTQFHGVNGKCVTVTNAHKTDVFVEVAEWAQIFMETADAINYVHKKGFLHNDIKGDNVIITKVIKYHPVLIDFGKSRKVKDAKKYTLNIQEQKTYRRKYWHIAPELVKGTHRQSFVSDIYSFGVMLKSVCVSTKYQQLKEIAKDCMNETPDNRPSMEFVQDKLLKFIK